MRRTLNDQIKYLQDEIIKMSNAAYDAISKSISALKDQNVELARMVISGDDFIDNSQIVIDDGAMSAFSYGEARPMELRRILAFVKIANDLERIGDYAVNIAEMTLKMKDKKYIKDLEDIPKLSDMALDMLRVAFQALAEDNSDLADAVCRRDEAVDNLTAKICQELNRMLVEQWTPEVGLQAPNFIRVAEYLERVADHATNVGEQTIYISSGRRVRY